MPSRVNCPPLVRILMRLLAVAMTFMALTAYAAGPSNARYRPSTITRIRQLALADSHAPGRPAAATVLAHMTD